MDTISNSPPARRARANVAGSEGPRRESLPSFHALGRVDPVVLALSVIEIADFEAGARQTECCTDLYPISHGNPLNDLFGEHYRQRLLQLPRAGTDGLSERDYTQPRGALAEAVVAWLPSLPLFRLRLAALPAGGIADWHIDTNTTVACRVLMMVGGENTWFVRRKAGVDERRMVAGEFWFANTAYPHRIENRGAGTRYVLLASCDHATLAATFGDFRLTEAVR